MSFLEGVLVGLRSEITLRLCAFLRLEILLQCYRTHRNTQPPMKGAMCLIGVLLTVMIFLTNSFFFVFFSFIPFLYTLQFIVVIKVVAYFLFGFSCKIVETHISTENLYCISVQIIIFLFILTLPRYLENIKLITFTDYSVKLILLEIM